MFVKRGTVTQPIAEIMINRLKAIIDHSANETTVQATTNADIVVSENKRGDELLRELINKRLIDK